MTSSSIFPSSGAMVRYLCRRRSVSSLRVFSSSSLNSWRSTRSPFSTLGSTMLLWAIASTAASMMEAFFWIWFTSDPNSPMLFTHEDRKSLIPRLFQFRG